MPDRIVYVILYFDGRKAKIPVHIDKLPGALRDVYEPFVGKTVTWDHGSIVEVQEA